MRRLVLRIIGFVLFGAGLVVFALPLPFGFLMIAIGLVLVVANSDWAAGQVRRARIRSPRVHRSLRQAGRRMPRRFYRILAATDPRRAQKQIGL